MFTAAVGFFFITVWLVTRIYCACLGRQTFFFKFVQSCKHSTSVYSKWPKYLCSACCDEKFM